MMICRNCGMDSRRRKDDICLACALIEIRRLEMEQDLRVAKAITEFTRRATGGEVSNGRQ